MDDLRTKPTMCPLRRQPAWFFRHELIVNQDINVVFFSKTVEYAIIDVWFHVLYNSFMTKPTPKPNSHFQLACKLMSVSTIISLRSLWTVRFPHGLFNICFKNPCRVYITLNRFQRTGKAFPIFFVKIKVRKVIHFNCLTKYKISWFRLTNSEDIWF